jgi:hypothetical protein
MNISASEIQVSSDAMSKSSGSWYGSSIEEVLRFYKYSGTTANTIDMKAMYNSTSNA